MQDSTAERSTKTRKEPKRTEEDLEQSKEQWRQPFHLAFTHWLGNQKGLNILSMSQLNRIISDPAETHQRQAQAADIIFATAAESVTKDPNERLFPQTETIRASQLDDTSIVFLAQYLHEDYPTQPIFQRMATRRGLLQPQLGQEMVIEVPRPEFILKAVTGARNAA